MDESTVQEDNDPSTSIEYVEIKASIVEDPYSPKKVFKCERCDKVYATNAGRYNHEIHKHGMSPYSKASIYCREPDCVYKCSTRERLQCHLVTVHKKQLAFSTLKFSSKQKFDEWKELFEKQQKCRFVKKSGSRIRASTGKKHTYLYCSRSGTFISSRKGLRSALKKGTSKISNYCTASIDCVEEENGAVIAKLCSTHYGHEPSVEYLRLTKSDKIEIAEKLSKGVPRDVVIDNARASVGENIDRLHFLTMKDIKNIERRYGIKCDKHISGSEGYSSVNDWVKEMESLGDENPIIFYKKKHAEASECKYQFVKTDDFCLVLMTKVQQDILKKFGPDGVFYITWLNITNGYDLSLLTLMVVDDINDAFPVSFFLCSQMTSEMEILFFNVIKDKLGTFCARAIMTDDRKSLYDSWCTVMGFVPYHLLSNRFVDADWRDRLISVEREDVQDTVYEVLYSYLSCTDSSEFEKTINNFTAHLKANEETQVFGLYFEDNYLHRMRLWAGCYDKKVVGINEHLNLDLVYNDLVKVCNCRGKFSKLLDKTLQGLLTIVRDRQHIRMTKIMEQTQNLDYLHEISESIELDDIQELENQWQIKPKLSNFLFTVTRKTYKCSIKCTLMCFKCKMCSHMFECTCKVYNINRTMCKHIHAIGRLLNKDHPVEEVEITCDIHNNSNSNLESENEPTEYLQTCVFKEEILDADTNVDTVIKSNAHPNCSKLLADVNCLLLSLQNYAEGVSKPELLRSLLIKLKKVKRLIKEEKTLNKEEDQNNPKTRGRPKKIKPEGKKKVGRPKKYPNNIDKTTPRFLQDIIEENEQISKLEMCEEEHEENSELSERQQNTVKRRKRGRPRIMQIKEECENEPKMVKLENVENDCNDYPHRRKSTRVIKVKSYDNDEFCSQPPEKPQVKSKRKKKPDEVFKVSINFSDMVNILSNNNLAESGNSSSVNNESINYTVSEKENGEINQNEMVSEPNDSNSCKTECIAEKNDSSSAVKDKEDEAKDKSDELEQKEKEDEAKDKSDELDQKEKEDEAKDKSDELEQKEKEDEAKDKSDELEQKTQVQKD